MADQEHRPPRKRRNATLYDTVAGRVGPNGFLTPEQLESSSVTPHQPHEVLLRSVTAPDDGDEEVCSADQGLHSTQVLPDSELVKAIHAYASDFYDMATSNAGQHDFKSFDETALLAIGILLEEAAAEMLGETGDMTLVEPKGLEQGLPESKMVKHQIKGRVKPPPPPEDGSDQDVSDKMRSKKRKMTR
jgi:UAF complex subunit Rrn10